VKQQLGPTNPADLEKELAEDFEFVAPLVGPLPPKALIAATAGLDLDSAIPDFDARYHDFRMDCENPRRVWCQMRVCGTQTGEFSFLGTQALPSDPPVRFENPPEAVSVTFDSAGKVREITTGFPMDRRCGTTGGLGGIFGILEGLGRPLPVVLTRTCGEITAPIAGVLGLADEAELVAPPPPPVLEATEALDEDRLFALTEKLIASRFGLDDPSQLADSFTSSGPAGGCLPKAQFLDIAASINVEEAFPDLDNQWRDIRVCPFDVNRVWYTSSPVGTHSKDLVIGGEVFPVTGKRWVSPPQCGSAQFDSKGRCISLTGGYVMDRRLGNTSGLGGLFGLREAIGSPSPRTWTLRTPTQLWNSFMNGS